MAALTTTGLPAAIAHTQIRAAIAGLTPVVVAAPVLDSRPRPCPPLDTREETTGIAHLIAGIAVAYDDDEQRIAAGAPLFDNLYEYFRKAS